MQRPDPDLDEYCQFCDEGDIYNIKSLVMAFKSMGFGRDILIDCARDIICGYRYGENGKRVTYSATCPVCDGTGMAEC